MEPWVWSIILFLLALAIIALELFIPSGGVLGVLATMAIVGSLVFAFMDGWGTGATMTIVVIVVVPLVLASALKWWPHTPIGQKILNTPPENADDVLPETDPRYELRELIGTLAIAKTKMLPSGIVMIGKRSYDAVGEGPAIEPGQTVRVIGVDMNRLEVRFVASDPAPADSQATPAVSADRATGDDILQRPLEAFGLEPLDDSKRT